MCVFREMLIVAVPLSVVQKYVRYLNLCFEVV